MKSRLTILIVMVSLLSCCERSGTVIDIGRGLMPLRKVNVQDFIPKRRSSVTFIMGSDHYTYNQYYTLASHYYRINAEERTDYVVESITSLSRLLEWLQHNPTPDSLPWGVVNIVTHGNEFLDLEMTVTPGGRRTSPQLLQEAIDKALLKIPDSSIIDQRTQLILHGCAVGNNQPLLDGLTAAFGGRTPVTASKLFEYYAYLTPNRNPQNIAHYYARAWYAFMHPDSAYDEDAVVRQLRKRYPADTTHWREGLRRRFQDNPSQIYHYSFIVPCTYSEFYEEASNLPSVSNAQKRQKWVDSHSDFREMLKSTTIPEEYFQIKFYRQSRVTGNNEVQHGLRVKARAQVICLIQPEIGMEPTAFARSCN